MRGPMFRAFLPVSPSPPKAAGPCQSGLTSPVRMYHDPAPRRQAGIRGKGCVPQNTPDRTRTMLLRHLAATRERPSARREERSCRSAKSTAVPRRTFFVPANQPTPEHTGKKEGGSVVPRVLPMPFRRCIQIGPCFRAGSFAIIPGVWRAPPHFACRPAAPASQTFPPSSAHNRTLPNVCRADRLISGVCDTTHAHPLLSASRCPPCAQHKLPTGCSPSPNAPRTARQAAGSAKEENFSFFV